MNAKASSDEYLRSFKDGSLFATLPEDLREAIRIILYLDDLELLQGLSVKQGIYKVAGIYFGIENLPADMNALLTNIFVTALAYAGDAKEELVWAPFLAEMKQLETVGAEIIVDGEPFRFKAVLIAQIGDDLAAQELLGLRGPSAKLFCRSCYIKRPDMWADAAQLAEPRTTNRHLLDIAAAGDSKAMKTALGVNGPPPPIRGLRFYQPIENSIFDIFHDLPQGICKMEIRLALREYVIVRKYFTEETLKSRLQFFDYGFTDKKNRPSANITAAFLSKQDSYNLHQTGSQMWLFTRAFSFLIADLVPEDDKFIELISLLNQIMTIVFAHAISEYDLNHLQELIMEHHKLFKEIFPGEPQQAQPQQDQEMEVEREEDEEEVDDPESRINEDDSEEEGLDVIPEYFGEVDEDLDVAESDENDDNPRTSATMSSNSGKKERGRKKKKKRVVRMINKHHHLLHYIDIIRKYGPLVLYWCARYEAKHYFFKLAATVCHNFINVLKTLMDMLQMKTAADRRQPEQLLVMGKRGTKLFTLCDTPHCTQLILAGLHPFSKVYTVKHVSFNGVDYRPELFVTLELQKRSQHPVFACIKAAYVLQNEDSIYLVIQQWRTVQFEARYSAYSVSPIGSAPLLVM